MYRELFLMKFLVLDTIFIENYRTDENHQKPIAPNVKVILFTLYQRKQVF
jgi:hypothetical protein